MSARERQSLARDGHRRRAKVRQEDAAARGGRAQGHVPNRWEWRFPQVELWRLGRVRVKVVSQRFEGKFRSSC